MTENTLPNCPTCGSADVRSIEWSRSGAHCTDCNRVFDSDMAAFRESVDELKETMRRELRADLNRLRSRLRRSERD